MEQQKSPRGVVYIDTNMKYLSVPVDEMHLARRVQSEERAGTYLERAIRALCGMGFQVVITDVVRMEADTQHYIFTLEEDNDNTRFLQLCERIEAGEIEGASILPSRADAPARQSYGEAYHELTSNRGHSIGNAPAPEGLKELFNKPPKNAHDWLYAIQTFRDGVVGIDYEAADQDPEHTTASKNSLEARYRKRYLGYADLSIKEAINHQAAGCPAVILTNDRRASEILSSDRTADGFEIAFCSISDLAGLMANTPLGEQMGLLKGTSYKELASAFFGDSREVSNTHVTMPEKSLERLILEACGITTTPWQDQLTHSDAQHPFRMAKKPGKLPALPDDEPTGRGR